MSKKKLPCPVCEERCRTGKVLPVPCFNCNALGTVDSNEDETEETTCQQPTPADSPPPAGDMPTPAMGRLVYRDYYAGSEPAVIGNMHNVLDERIDSRHVMMDLFQRAGVQDGDEFLISVQRIGSKFPETKFVIGEQGRLMKFTSEKKIILPG